MYVCVIVWVGQLLKLMLFQDTMTRVNDNYENDTNGPGEEITNEKNVTSRRLSSSH